MKKLFVNLGEVTIEDNRISLSNYPFRPSISYPKNFFLAEEVAAIILRSGMIKIFVKEDVLLISAEKKEEIEMFAKRNSIREIENSWNWDWILEPYLDTEYTDETDALLLQRLSEKGIAREEVETVRKEVGRQMYKYNFHTMLWEWQSLGLFDVLSAMRAKYNKNDFKNFYWRAIEIEKRGIEW